MSHLLGCPKNSNPYAECECERQSRLNLQNELERNTEALNSHRSTIEQDIAALRARCERLEGALNHILAHKITGVNMIVDDAFLADALELLAQPEDGK